MHQLDQSAHTLPDVTEFFAGDSRAFSFQVVDGNGDPVDITGSEIEWRLFDREYQTAESVAVLSSTDESVEVVTDERADLENGEWELRLSPEATDGLYGEYYHRPIVVDAGDNRASWRGEVIVTA